MDLMTKLFSLGVAASLEGVKIVFRFLIRFFGLAWHLCASQPYNGCLTLFLQADVWKWNSLCWKIPC